MVKKIRLQQHLDRAELERRYRGAADPVERTHYQIIWLLASGKTTGEVVAVTGYSRGWVQEIARRYSRDGPAGLGDRRHANPGAAPLLDAAGQEELRGALAGDAPDGGLWSGPKVAAWIAAKLGRAVSERVGWDYLRRVRYSPQVPRPTHAEADAAERAAFPKRLRARVAAMRRRHPRAEVEVWAQDEHRVGLQPILRRVWAPVGERPVVAVRPRYEWLWVYGFVRPATGATEWVLLPHVNTEAMSQVLAHFAELVGAGPDKRVILVLDRAGWHTSAALRVPAGLHLAFLPAHCPELQPAERRWPLADEGVANKCCRALADLEAALARQLVALKDEVVRALTCYHWWPRMA